MDPSSISVDADKRLKPIPGSYPCQQINSPCPPSCLWTEIIAQMPAWFFSVSPHTFALQRWLGNKA